MKKLLLLFFAVFFVLILIFINATTTGPNSGLTFTDNSSIGNVTWIDPSNASSSDGNFSTATLETCGWSIYENSIKIIQGNNTVGTEHSTNAQLPKITPLYITYGNSSDLWGLNWTASDINNQTFGVSFSAKDTGISFNVSHFLIAENFSFSIPNSATINGIVAEIQQKQDAGGGNACP